MEQRRVVITGIGAITPIGLGVEGLWQGLQRRESAVRCITRFDPSVFKSRIAGEVDDFRPADHMEERRSRRLDRFSQFSVAATRMALSDAGLDPAREDPDRIGAMMGTALGGVAHGEGQYRNFMQGGPRAVDPALALTVFAGAASCNIAIEFGFTGPNSTNGMSCASGAIAIGEAFRAIARGEADVMVAGGAEAPLAPLCFGAFAIIRAMSTRNDDPAHASRPFDQGRDGFVMAEGAAVLVLEERGRALARGAPVYAEVCGFGLTNDAHHMTAPTARRAPGSSRHAERADRSTGSSARGRLHQRARLVHTAQRFDRNRLGQAGVRRARIPSGVQRHQGLLRPCPRRERRHRGRHLRPGQPTWLGSSHGEPGSPDPACDLDHVTGTGRTLAPDYLLSNSFGFGGINAALLFRRSV